MLTPLFALTLLTGFIFVIIWAARFATKVQLKHAISWFLAIGIAGALLGSTFGLSGRRGISFKFGSNSPFMMMGGAFRDADDQNGWFGCPGANGVSSASSAASTIKK